MYQPANRRVVVRRDRGVIGPMIAGGGVVGALLVAASMVGFGLLRNPVRTELVDHSPAPILTELRDLAEFHAAQAQFEVVVDQEEDVNLVPQFIAGERVQYVAIGSVDAVVDFTHLSEAAIAVDGTSVTIALPQPVLGKPVLDPAASYVMNRDRGLVDRVGAVFADNPTSEQGLMMAASDKMAGAAANSDIVDRAEGNTTAMLESMLGALGYEQVEVRFDGTGSNG